MKSLAHTFHRGRLALAALVFLMLPVIIATGCSSGADYSTAPRGHAMYFWRTALTLDNAELNFLKANDIRQLYIRFFDVVTEADDTVPHPNATISFPRGNVIPEGVECIPVVFITPGCLRYDSLPSLAAKTVRRVVAMAETNSLPRPGEIQIDCDWTASTRDAFFRFMEELHARAGKEGMKTSVTIRLHQLSTAPPAADYGVLMCYNTGDLTHPAAGNPILSLSAVEPYLRHLKSYPLPLVAAYPNFRWPALYDGSGEFVGILYGCDPAADPTIFRPAGKGVWKAVGSERFQTSVGSSAGVVRVAPGMTLRMFAPPPAADMIRLKDALADRQPHINQSVILFDLNPTNINIYTSEDYETIFAD